MMLAALSTFCSKVAAATSVAWATGAARRTAEIARAQMRLFGVICGDKQAMHKPPSRRHESASNGQENWAPGTHFCFDHVGQCFSGELVNLVGHPAHSPIDPASRARQRSDVGGGEAQIRLNRLRGEEDSTFSIDNFVDEKQGDIGMRFVPLE